MTQKLIQYQCKLDTENFVRQNMHFCSLCKKQFKRDEKIITKQAVRMKRYHVNCAVAVNLWEVSHND